MNPKPSFIMTLPAGHALISLLLLLPFAGAQPTPVNPQNPDPYGRFNPSMAVIIVILIAALFFTAFFTIYIRHCNGASSAVSRSVRLRSALRTAQRGLDPAVIETFPTLVYSTVKGLKIGKGALECAVCLNEFEDDETLRLIPKCDHVFHPECIGAWLEAHTTCPVCRADLVPQPGESIPQLDGLDAELQNHEVAIEIEEQQTRNVGAAEEAVSVPQAPEAIDLSGKLNRNGTRGSRSGRQRKFPRSHSTGHSFFQPGEDTERFTLKLPAEVRREIMNRKLNRAASMVVLPREGSSRRGYRTGSSRGKYYRRIEEFDEEVKSGKWGFGKVGPFLSRMSSSVRSLSITSLSVRSPKVASGEGSSLRAGEPMGSPVQLSRPPI